MNEAEIRQAVAQQRIKEFEQKYGSPSLELACHAALPVVLNSELLHFLRINFFSQRSELLPMTAEASLLLSPLCREIGNDLYEMDPEVRNLLLQNLATQFEPKRVQQVAGLLGRYLQRRVPWRDQTQLNQAQQFTVLNALNPTEAKSQLDKMEQTQRRLPGGREWFVAMRRELERQTKYSQPLPVERVDSKPLQAGLEALKELLQNPEVRKAVGKFHYDFQTVYDHIDVVKDCKELHDLLQELEQACYFPILQAAPGYPQNDSTLEFLQAYADEMQNIIDKLQDVTHNGNVAPEGLQWMKYIERARVKLNDAIAKPEPGALGAVIGYLDRVLTYLSVINDYLNQAAQDLALPRLVTAVEQIDRGLKVIEATEYEKVMRFRAGAKTLAELTQQFSALIDEQNRWQAIDLELQITERDVEKKDMNKLRLFWPDLQAMVATMCDQANPWSETLARYANEVDKVLAAPESKPEEIQKCFRRYRRHALNRFRQVDNDLLKACVELRRVCDPLNEVLGELELDI